MRSPRPRRSVRRHDVRSAIKHGAAGGNRHGYAGYEFEPVTSYAFWHARHRVLNSDLGRWPTRDPVDYTDGDNLYQYVVSNPLNRVDPSGLVCRIAIRCGFVGDPGTGSGGVAPFRHCELVIFDGTGTYVISGSGGPCNNFNYVSPSPPWGTQYPSYNYPDALCACLNTEVTWWNRQRCISRDDLCRNSNWSLKCLLRRCGYGITWGTPGAPIDPPQGWHCRRCVEWFVTPPDEFGVSCRTCLRYEDEPCP